MRMTLLTAGLLALAPFTASAQDADVDAAAAEAPNTWVGTGELGLAISKGNTDSETLVGSLSLGYHGDVWHHGAGASFLYGKSDDEENAYRYEFWAQSGRDLSERSYLLGSIRNERDHFASNEYQWTAAVGYGFRAIDTEATKLLFEVGPGYRWSKLQDVQVHRNEGIVRGTMAFAHQFNDSTSISNDLLVEAGSENTFVRNDLALKVKMTEALALKAGVEVRHNTDVLPDTKKTDTLTTVNVVYDF
ncbi:DUF481 domain-containing protein [Lysobacter sp. SG-8]|uniref:DUF481 domain-containing protein n=1 Tax=Marilutibacter penaei TaxID=2759900 RepID=A0A7W3U1I0_9GAMM|nr:DUF481 domain-containing protein [Lysobacter penaei]MBB1087169.1 DUF481 domain-containing protein [Lysobacter penaei]